LSAAKFFGFEITWSKMADVTLFGRMQKISDHITIDVGHNPLAAKVIAQSYKNRKIVLVYNSYNDKDYQKILEILKPIIKRVEILPIYNQRIEAQDQLEETIASLDIPYREFEGIDDRESYLVFGSFAVAEEFLKHYAKGKSKG